MVKARTLSQVNILPQIPTKQSRAEKIGGIKYRVIRNIKVPGFHHELKALETELNECNDGWFEVWEREQKKYYRLGPSIIEEEKQNLEQI